MSKFILTCEHGGYQIPSFLQSKLKLDPKISQTHRAFDIGALNVAMSVSFQLDRPLIYNEITRLLIDYNRSEKNKNFWGPLAKDINKQDKYRLLQDYHVYRETAKLLLKKAPLNFSIHSFTPVLNDEVRNCDMGILYDPKRPREKKIALHIQKKLISQGINCRLNYPYLGTTDGMSTYFRNILNSKYAGIEVEINQKIIFQEHVTIALLDSLQNF